MEFSQHNWATISQIICHSGAVLRLTASQWYSRVIIQFSVFVWLDSINIWLYQGPLFFLLIQEDRRASAERTSIILNLLYHLHLLYNFHICYNILNDLLVLPFSCLLTGRVFVSYGYNGFLVGATRKQNHPINRANIMVC